MINRPYEEKGVVDITPLTLADFPDKVACIFWFSLCNLRCRYCYNTSLVSPQRQRDHSPIDYLSFLKSRVGFLDGVVLSGGECTLSPNLPEICQEIKKLGLLVKVDTNGTNPDVLKHLVENQLVDYIALDYKAPSRLFHDITGNPKLFPSFSQSLNYLISSQIDFEVRTTIHPDIIQAEHINMIIDDLAARQYQGTYYLQYYFHTPHNLGHLGIPTQEFHHEKLRDSINVEFRNFTDLYH